MALAAEVNANLALLQIAVLQGNGAGVMVGGNHHQGVAVLGGEFQHVAQGAVEVQELLHGLLDVVAVQPVVDAGAFDHHHEAVFILRELVQALGHHAAEQVSALPSHGQVVRGQDADDRHLGRHQLFLGEGYGVAGIGHLLGDVTAVLAVHGEPVQTAACQVIHTAGHVVGDEVVLIIAELVVAAEVAGGSIGKVAGDHGAGLLAHLGGIYQDGILVRCVRRRAHVAVGGLHTRGQGRSTGTGIGDELVGAPGAGQAHVGHIVQVQLAVVQHPGAAHLFQSHAVSNEEDDVLHLIALRRLLNGNDVVSPGGGVILQRSLFLLAGNRGQSDDS